MPRRCRPRRELAVLSESPQRRECVEVRAVVPAVEGRVDRSGGGVCGRRICLDQSGHGDALVDRDVGPDLEHLAPPMRDESLPLRFARDLLGQRLGGSLVRRSRQCSATIAPLSSVLIPTRSSSDRSRRATKRGASASWPSRDPVAPRPPRGAAARSRGFRRRRVHRGRRPGARRGRDGRSGSRPARSARRACAGSDASPRALPHRGLRHDRCDRPIDVGEHRRPLRMLTERRNQGVEPAVACAAFLCAPPFTRSSIARHVPDPEAGGDRDGRRRLQRPARRGRRQRDGPAADRLARVRRARGDWTSLIVVIAALAVALQAIYGNVDPPNAALVGIPAIAGRSPAPPSSSACPSAPSPGSLRCSSS